MTRIDGFVVVGSHWSHSRECLQNLGIPCGPLLWKPLQPETASQNCPILPRVLRWYDAGHSPGELPGKFFLVWLLVSIILLGTPGRKERPNCLPFNYLKRHSAAERRCRTDRMKFRGDKREVRRRCGENDRVKSNGPIYILFPPGPSAYRPFSSST